MKYVLISRHTKEVVWRTDIASDVGISGARTYFIGVKQTGPEEFDKLWEVITQKEYDDNHTRITSSKPIRWWKDIGESSNLDEW